MEQLHLAARARNSSLYSAIEYLIAAGQLKGKTAATLQKMLEQFARWRSLIEAPSPIAQDDNAPANLFTPENAAPTNARGEEYQPISLAELTDLMLDESGYRPMWQADTSPEAAGRLDNLRELVRALGDFPTLPEFLEHVGLVMEMATENGNDMVNIMSLHAAKGLEFDVVFLAGWEEGIFPSQRTLDELGTAGLEEERRLAYVGITRASQHLTLTHAANRRVYNHWQSQLPSRFLAEIPPETIEEVDGNSYTRRASGPAMFQREVDAILGTRLAPPSRAVESSVAVQTSTFHKGARVFHQKFGTGVILNTEGDHLQIAFKHAGVKKILAEYVELAP